MLKLYYDLLSQPCRALYILLSKNNLPFQKCQLALRKGEHKTEDYAQINPFQLVPAIEDNGFKLTESIAIFRYILNKYPDKFEDFWYPKDIEKRARVDEYLEWQHLNSRLFGAMVFQKSFIIPLTTQKPPDEKSLNKYKAGLETVLDKFENVWLKDKPYIAGSHLTFADLMAVCELQQPGVCGHNIHGRHPKLTDWFYKIENEMNPQMKEVTTLLSKIREVGLPLVPKN